ncbi:unnamed protein product [Mytilus coruscus]|uniref:Uncharacterized protein n=1 Tax=Mytilus coruscus TaxID=42192 RepID=A0A6J8CNE6_MYTCO|nr:unnamed protein product [Mytilus coruscus]
MCATLTHRKCENVISLQKAASDIRQSTQTTELVGKLKEKGKELNEKVQNPSDHVAKFTSSTQSLGGFKRNEQRLERTSNTYNKHEKYSIDGKFLATLPVGYSPADVTQVDQSQVAISLYNKVLIVDSTDLELLQTFDLQGISVNGLCFIDHDQFIVSYSSTLTWINSSSGQKIKERTTNGSSYFISTSNKKDYICCDGNSAASRVVGKTTKFTYMSSQLFYPRGMGIDFVGNIYIWIWF